MSNAELQRKFRAAVNGEPNSMIELVKEYLKHPDNPDYVERAYRLLQQGSFTDESTCLLARFHWGNFGKKYINFVECERFLHVQDGGEQIRLLQKGIKKVLLRKIAGIIDNDRDRWIRICALYHYKKYEDALKLISEIQDTELKHCAEYLGGYIYDEWYHESEVDNNRARHYYERAAKYGSLPGMLKAADGDNLRAAFKHYHEAAKRGDDFSMAEVAAFYYDGKVVDVNNKVVQVAFADKPKAFRWLYKASYISLIHVGSRFFQGISEGHYDLARWYLDGKLMPNNYAEAYTWLTPYNNKHPMTSYDEERADLTKQINDNLPLKPKRPYLHLAEKYYKRYNEHGCLGPFTSEDLDPYLDYILDAYSREDNLVFDATEDVSRILIELGKHPFETTAASPSVFISKQRPNQETSDDSDHDTPTDKNIEEIEESFEVQFEHIKNIEKNSFDPKKIRITLYAGKGMSKTDFNYIMFSYGRLNDKKDKSMFQGKIFKIGPRERKLLIALALHSGDEVAQKTAIRAAKRDAISRLNKMLLLVFKGCFREEQSNLIDNDKAELKIKSIIFHDVWNIKDCPDYQECKRIKT